VRGHGRVNVAPSSTSLSGDLFLYETEAGDLFPSSVNLFNFLCAYRRLLLFSSVSRFVSISDRVGYF
jgi:hypothetical protein